MSKFVYVIGLSGPEWLHMKEAHLDKEEALKRCNELNKELREKLNKDIFEKLSSYEINEVPLVS